MILYQEENSVRNYNYNVTIWHNFRWIPHFHANYELIYVLSGNLEITVDEQSEILETGDFALVLPNQIHHFIVNDSYIWIGVFSDDYVTHFALQMKGKQGNTFRFRCDDVTKNYLLEKLIKDEIPGINVLKSCLYAACDQYINSVTLIPRKNSGNSLVHQILNYIADHFTEDVTLQELAEELGYEYHYISRCLHKMFHMNFKQMINQYRVEYAITLMKDKKISMTDIAFQSGFQSVRSFNAIFKECTGTQPRHYVSS